MSQPLDEQQLLALYEAGRYADAEYQARRLLEVQPESGFGWKILGAAVSLQGRDAVAILRKAVELSPHDHEAHNNLGASLFETGKNEEAVRCYRRALKIQPRYASAYGNLGNALARSGRIEEAVPSYRRALELNPRFAEAHTGLGSVLFRLDRIQEAQRSLETAIRLMPDLGIAHFHLGDVLLEQGRLYAALAAYQRVVQLKQVSGAVHARLGFVLQELGRPQEALDSYAAALAADPANLGAFSSALFTRNELAVESCAALRAQAEDYGRLAMRGAQPAADWPNDPDPDRVLRVGLVSGDLYSHPVGYFLESLVSALPRERIALAAYQTRDKTDGLSARLQHSIRTWRAIFNASDDAAVQQIREDGIDILIDLAGHTGYNRLPIFARRPAPVQISWLGYFATTGLPTIDYILVDPLSVPLGEEDAFTEAVWRLPETRLCFTPPAQDEPVSPLPAWGSRSFTYGCFGRLTKVTDAVMLAWAQILQASPNAKLFLKAKQLIDPGVRDALMERCTKHGLPVDRLIIEGPSPRREYFASYKRVDVVLDTFPYPGGTTTLEALWMGVPVVTLRGDRMLSRQGESILANAGLSDWIAKDVDDYVRIALRAAQSSATVAELRSRLRAQLQASPMMDGARFAAHWEAALRQMWRRWCSALGD